MVFRAYRLLGGEEVVLKVFTPAEKSCYISERE
jgi:hypothetical protein